MTMKSTANGLTLLYLLIVVPFLGFILNVLAILGFDFITIKIVGLIVKDGVLLTAAMVAIFSLVARKKIPQTILTDIFLPFFLSALAFLWIVPSIGAVHASAGFAAFRNYVCYPFSYIALYHLSLTAFTDWDIRRLRRYVLYVLCGTYTLAILQYFGILPNVYNEISGKGAGTFVMVSGGTFSYIEFSAIVPLMLIAHCLLSSRALTNISISIVGLSIIIISQSRAGLVGIFSSIFFLCFRWLRIGSAFLFLPLALLIVSLFVLSSDVFERLGNVFGDLRFQSLLPYAIEKFVEKPLLGHGIGAFGGSATVTFDANKASISHIDTSYLDSSILAFLLQMGLVGSCIYFFAISAFVANTAYHLIVRRWNLYFLALVVIASITLFYSMFFNFIDAWPGAFLFFGGLGLFRGLIRRDQLTKKIYKTTNTSP